MKWRRLARSTEILERYSRTPWGNRHLTVLDILSKADKVIAYNAAFEDSYLKAYGIEVDPEKWIDPMIMFAEIYGEWNERRGSYKWQSLTKCATYYGYEFKAHDSLEDVKATLYAYKKMREKKC